jgi:hypothetical protein
MVSVEFLAGFGVFVDCVIFVTVASLKAVGGSSVCLFSVVVSIWFVGTIGGYGPPSLSTEGGEPFVEWRVESRVEASTRISVV